MMTFNELWEQEERQGLQLRLRKTYPAWQRRRKQRLTLVCSVAVLVAIALPTVHYSLPTKQYDSVACNRSGIPSGHWAEVAGNILTIETI